MCVTLVTYPIAWYLTFSANTSHHSSEIHRKHEKKQIIQCLLFVVRTCIHFQTILYLLRLFKGAFIRSKPSKLQAIDRIHFIIFINEFNEFMCETLSTCALCMWSTVYNKLFMNYLLDNDNVCAGQFHRFWIPFSLVHCYWIFFIFHFVRIMFAGKSISFHVIIQLDSYSDTLHSIRSLAPSSPASDDEQMPFLLSMFWFEFRYNRQLIPFNEKLSVILFGKGN